MAPISVIKTPTTFRIILIISVPSQLTSLSVHLYVTAHISDKTSACCPLQKGAAAKKERWTRRANWGFWLASTERGACE